MKMKLVPLAFCLFTLIYGQSQTIFLGAGHGNISVTASSELEQTNWSEQASGLKELSREKASMMPLFKPLAFLLKPLLEAIRI